MNMNEANQVVKAMHMLCVHHPSIKHAYISYTTEFDGTPQTNLYITFVDGNKTTIGYVASGSMVGIVSEVK